MTAINRNRELQSGAVAVLAIVFAAKLSAAAAQENAPASASCSSAKAFADPLSGPHWNGWGVDPSQRRELDATLRRKTRVALDHAILHLDCAANGIDDASELYEDAVTRPLDDAAVMHGDGGIDQIASQRSEAGKSRSPSCSITSRSSGQ